MDKESTRIIFKLARHKYWGGKHTSIVNLAKGAPKDRWGKLRN